MCVEQRYSCRADFSEIPYLGVTPPPNLQPCPGLLSKSNKNIRYFIERLKDLYNVLLLFVFLAINHFFCDIKDEAEETVDHLPIKTQHDQLCVFPFKICRQSEIRNVKICKRLVRFGEIF